MTASIELRQALTADKAAVSALSAKIWDGDDYLAHNFDSWLAHQTGRFTVAYAGQQLVGCGKLTEFRPGEWWLEGLRVDPDWRGQGIARLLHNHVIGIASEIAAAEKITGKLRLATDSDNYPVHKLALNSGFHQTSQHLLLIAAPETADTPVQSSFQLVRPFEKPHLTTWFNESAHFQASGGLFEDTWKWYEIKPRLDNLLADSRIYWWRKEDSHLPAAGLVIVHRRDSETMVLNYLDTPTADWADLLEDVRQLGRLYHVNQLKSKPLSTIPIRASLPETAWQIEYNMEMWLFERPIG